MEQLDMREQARRHRVRRAEDARIEREQLGARIRRIRVERGFSQARAAGYAGIHPKTWGRWESGQTTPRLTDIGRVTTAIGVPAAALTAPEGYKALIDVILSPQTLERLRREGDPAIDEVTAVVASQLRAAIAGAVDAPPQTPVRARGTRHSPARSRVEVLTKLRNLADRRLAAAIAEQEASGLTMG
jgi:transcriptional regulator with XRE-family HTH domain